MFQENYFCFYWFQPVTVLYQKLLTQSFLLHMHYNFFKCRKNSNKLSSTPVYHLEYWKFSSMYFIFFFHQGHLSPHSATQSPKATLLNPGQTSMQESKSPPGQLWLSRDSSSKASLLGHLSLHSSLHKSETLGSSGHTDMQMSRSPPGHDSVSVSSGGTTGVSTDSPKNRWN